MIVRPIHGRHCNAVPLPVPESCEKLTEHVTLLVKSVGYEYEDDGGEAEE